MLLTVTTTQAPATDLGHLLHKHPGRVQSSQLSVGTAHVLYPEAGEQRCTAALLLEVDPVGLARGRRGGGGWAGSGTDASRLGQHVNDRPYAASSLLAVALGRTFRTALSGRCDARPELAASALPLELHVPALPCRGGPALARRLFAPLGWEVDARPVALDAQHPEWGDSRYVDLHLAGRVRLAEALNHLYVLLPVLDDAKHYWVGPEEVDKLVRAGAGWLAAHPDRELVSRRYLAHRGALTRDALARLAEVDDTDPETLEEALDGALDGALVEAPHEPVVPVGPSAAVGGGATGRPGRAGSPLAEQRRAAVLAVLREAGAQRVGDLGCGEGALVAALLADPAFTEVVATDVSVRALETAARRLGTDRMPERQRARLRLFQSSLTYRDARIAGLDAVVLSEVVEHVDPPRLGALARVVLGDAAPATVVVTTPNREHNVRYPELAAGALRHRDHRFEWTRAEFAAWCAQVAGEHGYAVALSGVGEDDPEVGPPTQLAVLTRG